MNKRNNKNKQRRNVRKTKRMQNNNKNSLPEMIPVVSQCSRNYMAALVNPFRQISPLPCVPDVIALPSQKFRTRAFGTLSTNATGQAVIGVNPYITCSNNSGSILISPSTYAPAAGNDFDFALAANTVSINPQSDYSAATFVGTLAQVRLVGCGVKIRYSGPQLTMAGRITCYRAPSNIGLQNGTINQLLVIPSTLKTTVNKKWRHVCYVPDDPDFLGYQPFSAGLPTIGRTAVLIIVVDGAPGNVTFDFEVSAYWEMIGNLNTSATNYTRSHSDPAGLGQAIAAVPQKVSSRPTDHVEKKSLWDLGQQLLTQASYVAFRGTSSYLDSLAKQYAQQKDQLALPSTVLVEEVDD